MRQWWLSLVSISVYPKAREKCKGDEVEREGISRHHRIYESHVHQLASLTKKKLTGRKSTCLRQNIIKKCLVVHPIYMRFRKGCVSVCMHTQSYPVLFLRVPLKHWSNSATQIIIIKQLNVQTGQEQLLSGIKNDPHLSIKISSLSVVINIACKLSPVSGLLYLSHLEIPGGYFRTFWVRMCLWDPGTLSLYQS